MRNRRRAFTIVEVLVVTIIIAIIAGIGVVAYKTLTNDADQRQAEALTRAVRSGMENYFRKNGEYPSVPQLTGGTTNGNSLSVAQYQTISTMIGVKTDMLYKGKFRLVPCQIDVCTSIPNTTASANAVYYITRASTDANPAGKFIMIGSCNVALSGSDAATSGSSSYIIAFRKPDGSAILKYRSAQGYASHWTGGCGWEN